MDNTPPTRRHLLRTMAALAAGIMAPPFPEARAAGAEEQTSLPRLPHRLVPGDRLRVTVNTQETVRPATRDALAISFHRVAGWAGLPYTKTGDDAMTHAYDTAIRDLHLPWTRFYGVGDEPFGLNGALDRIARLADRLRIPQEKIVLELETQGANRALAPETWASGVKYALDSGYRFRHWEITNEPWNRPAFPKTSDYRDHMIAVSKAIRAVQPDARIGMALWRAVNYWQHDMLLHDAAGHYDWVAPHYYNFTDAYKNSFEDVALAANYRSLADILYNQTLLDRYNPGRKVVQWDTEWALHSHGPNGGDVITSNRNGNIYGVLHQAVRLIYYVREALVAGASSWEMFSPYDRASLGILSSTDPGQRSMRYWLFYHFAQYVGRDVLPITGECPYHTGRMPGQGSAFGDHDFAGPATPALATLSEDRKRLYMVVANGFWERPVEAEFNFADFRPASRASALVLTHDNPDAHPYVGSEAEVVRPGNVRVEGANVRFTALPHSVTFVTLERG